MNKYIYTVIIAKQSQSGTTAYKRARAFSSLERALKIAQQELCDEWVVSVEILRSEASGL